LKYDVEKILDLYDRKDISVYIPELFSSYDVISKKTVKLNPEYVPKINMQK
jgi:hypothetical protein